MNDQELEKTIREYIAQLVHMSLATSKDNRPWVCEVHFAYDDDLNLYFVSDRDRRHSQEIEVNPNVAGNIITQHHKHQKVRGVYFEGLAERIEGIKEDHVGLRAYYDRLGGRSGMLLAAVSGQETAMYKISVTNYYLFDTYEPDRDKLQLPWNGGTK